MNDKDMLRQQALARRRELSAAERSEASARVVQRLLGLLAQQERSEPLLVYRSLDDEVDTTSLFATPSEPDGREVYAPVTHHTGHMHWRRTGPDTRWQTGSFGILEPADGVMWSPDRPAVLACPLVGFDRAGNRLGLGKGCFDRWLAEARGHIRLAIGLGFACQECPDIPAEAHDIPLDTVITENEVITCRNY